MKDRLEEFVRKHRAEFDMHEPDPGLWEKVQKSVAPRRVISWGYYLSRAAVVICLVGATLIAQRVWMNRKHGIAVNGAEAGINFPELREAEHYYMGVIDNKLRKVKPLLSEHPMLEEELKTDLSELDSIYQSLKNDLKDNIANHDVIEAMIQNYRLRISILEDMLLFLESINQEEVTYNTEQI